MKHKILKMFCATYPDLRLEFYEPFYHEKYEYATDGYSAIRIKSGQSNYPENTRIGEALRDYFGDKKPKLAIQILEKDYNKFKVEEMKNYDAVCPECDGYGSVKADYNGQTVTADCPECHGIGSIREMQKTGKLIYAEHQEDPTAKICNTVLSVKYIEKVHVLSIKLGQEIKVKESNDNLIIFNVGDYDVVIMANRRIDCVYFEYRVI